VLVFCGNKRQAVLATFLGEEIKIPKKGLKNISVFE